MNWHGSKDPQEWSSNSLESWAKNAKTLLPYISLETDFQIRHIALSPSRDLVVVLTSQSTLMRGVSPDPTLPSGEVRGEKNILRILAKIDGEWKILVSFEEFGKLE